MSFIRSSSAETYNRPSPEEVIKQTELLNTALKRMRKAKRKWELAFDPDSRSKFDPDVRQALLFTYLTREKDYKIQLGISRNMLHRAGTRRHRRKQRKTLRRK